MSGVHLVCADRLKPKQVMTEEHSRDAGMTEAVTDLDFLGEYLMSVDQMLACSDASDSEAEAGLL
ncbi:hypothetical protein EAI59_08935 [Escherichia coli]|nr:hypothetical protein EAI59_08935 [Escherichia coli]